MHRFLSGLSLGFGFVACSGGSGDVGSGDGGTTSSSTSSGGGNSTSSSGGSSTSSGGSSSGGSSGTAPATPQAILRVNGGAAASCVSVPAMSIGDFPDIDHGVQARPVKNGESEKGNVLSLTCRVAPNGSVFALNATVGIAGQTFELSGDVDAQGKGTALKMKLTGGGATWSSSTCTSSQGEPSMGAAAGRFWALLSCGGSTSANAETCDIFGQVRLENCAAQ